MQGLLHFMCVLTAMALHCSSGDSVSGQWSQGRGSGQNASLVVSSLEAAIESLRTQLAEAHSARQRDVEALRQQVGRTVTNGCTARI